MTPQKATLDSMRTLSYFVSYRRLSAQFQFSLSAVTLVYLSQCPPHPHPHPPTVDICAVMYGLDSEDDKRFNVLDTFFSKTEVSLPKLNVKHSPLPVFSQKG
jgi:hypothetical protein